MRSFIVSCVVLSAVSCAAKTDTVRAPTVLCRCGQSAVPSGQNHSFLASEFIEPTPYDNLDFSFRLPVGWQVTTIANNFIGLRSGPDLAYISIWPDSGTVQWRLVYYVDDLYGQSVCEHAESGRPIPAEERPEFYRAYYDENDSDSLIYLNWPDPETIRQFEAAIVLREGGRCSVSE